MSTRRWVLVWLLVLGGGVGTAVAEPPTPPSGPKPDGRTAGEPQGTKDDPDESASEPAYKGPEIRWATSFAEAVEEATQRNVPIYVHSHGSTCGPCRRIHKAVFRDPDYLAWANAETVHVLSYCLDPNPSRPEPMVEVDRGGTKVSVFRAYPMFTPDEMYGILGELTKRVKYPLTTPWAGVLSPDGTKVLAERISGTAKEFRALYDAEQKRLGTSLPRATWRTIRAALEASSAAEFDDAWRQAVEKAIAARDAAKVVPDALREAIEARIAALSDAARRRIEGANKEKDPGARAKALEKVRADFAGLPVAAEAR